MFRDERRRLYFDRWIIINRDAGRAEEGGRDERRLRTTRHHVTLPQNTLDGENFSSRQIVAFTLTIIHKRMSQLHSRATGSTAEHQSNPRPTFHERALRKRAKASENSCSQEVHRPRLGRGKRCRGQGESVLVFDYYN